MVGICSYLLINFWFRRLQANKAAIQAILMNRVGDWGFSLGLFSIFLIFGNLDLTTIVTLAPIVDGDLLNIISLFLLLGAMAKSAQIGLHVWLPNAMEGNKYINYNLRFINTLNKQNSNSKSFIWVYDINLQALVKQAPFISKSSCAKALKIDRHTVTSYLDKDKVLNQKWIFSSRPLGVEDFSKWTINPTVWEALTGDLLGDGFISKPSKTGSSRIEFTFSSQNLPYLLHLKFKVYKTICNSSDPTPYPNPKLTGKETTQYWFSSLTLPTLGALHSTWYKNVEGKYIKILPDNIESILTPIGLAHWIQGDGYWSEGTLILCTDNFTHEETLILVNILDKKFGLKAGLKRRIKGNGEVCYRIRFYLSSINNLRNLVSPLIIHEMLYKLGL